MNARKQIEDKIKTLQGFVKTSRQTHSNKNEVARADRNNWNAEIIGLEYALALLPDEDSPDLSLRQEKGENARDFAKRHLCSLFQHVFAHTGREMPEEFFDLCGDTSDAIVDAVREQLKEDNRNGY